MTRSKQKIAGGFVAISMLMLAGGCAHQTVTDSAVATASLVDAQGEDRGMATITRKAGALLMTLNANGIPAGKHGIHLHQVGKCDGPAFTSAGPHWNPAGRKHGLANSAGPHAGDFANIEATGSGKLTTTLALGAMELTGATGSLLDADGAAIVIHAKPDDNMTDPSGNSGDRIICGVINLAR